jgi:hypothetical protein
MEKYYTSIMLLINNIALPYSYLAFLNEKGPKTSNVREKG